MTETKKCLADVRICAGLLSLCCLAGMLSSSAAYADVVIVATTAPAYRVGQVLHDGDSLHLPGGSRMTVLLSTNSVREIKGPFDRQVADLSKGRPSRLTELWQQVTGYFESGGVNVIPGATRAVQAPGGSASQMAVVDKEAWKAVPANIQGTACAEKDAPVKFRRKGNIKGPAEVRLSDAGLKATGAVHWDAGQAEAPWPVSVPAASGEYILTVGGQAPRRFTFKLLDKSALGGDLVLVTLKSEGCSQQIDIWLQGASRP